MDIVIAKLIEMVESLSPKLWEILMKQVMVNTYVNLGWLLLAIPALIMGLTAFKLFSGDPDKNDGVFFGSGVFLTIPSLFGIIYLAVTTTKVLVNPEYYAIQLLLKQLVGGGQ